VLPCAAYRGTVRAALEFVMYERILVALDGSPVAEQILPHVEALAEKFGSTLVLARAIMPAAQVAALIEPSAGGLALDPELIDETIHAEEQEASSYLEHVASALRQRGLEVKTELLQGAAVEAIVDCARDLRADLLGLTTHGRSGLGKLIFGSVAEGVLHKTPCPTLLVRAGKR
jgi:nucleotide-binding universal stress UspA family protein